jgi:hypothetical protein
MQLSKKAVICIVCWDRTWGVEPQCAIDISIEGTGAHFSDFRVNQDLGYVCSMVRVTRPTAAGPVADSTVRAPRG